MADLPRMVSFFTQYEFALNMEEKQQEIKKKEYFR